MPGARCPVPGARGRVTVEEVHVRYNLDVVVEVNRQVPVGGATLRAEVSVAMNDVSYCDVTERMFSEFERVHPLPVIAAVVRQCREDLEGSSRGALPELCERLARQRLTDLPPTTSTILPAGSAQYR